MKREGESDVGERAAPVGQKGVLEEQKGTNREKCNWERPGTNGLERRLGVAGGNSAGRESQAPLP